MHVQRYIDWKRHVRTFSPSPWIVITFSCLIFNCTSFVYPNLFPFREKKKKKEEQKQQKVTQNLQFFSSDKKIPNLSIPRVEKKVFIQQLSQKKKKKIIPKIKSPYPFCSLVETLHTRSTLHPLSPNYPYTLILNLDDTRMNEACLCVCVGERKIEWTVARGTKPR